MELEGVVHNSVIVPDDATALPEGTRVRILPAMGESSPPFGQRFGRFKRAIPGLPVDLAAQHEHYRLRRHVRADRLSPDGGPVSEQAGFALRGRDPDVLTCIANLSNDEEFAPP
jgi:hypothetical protein